MRSMLFVPADSAKKFAKGMTSGADALIIDLEDSVAPDNKARARESALAFLQEASADPARPSPAALSRPNIRSAAGGGVG